MAEKFNIKCPVCNGTMSADSEKEAIQMAQQHAREKHDMNMTDQQARDLITKQQERDH